MRDYRLYLRDILAAMESIEAFVEGMDLETFRTDDKTASAVIRKLDYWRGGKADSRGDTTQLSRGPLERNGWNKGQADPFLLWRGLPVGLDNDKRAFTSGQATDSKDSTGLGLTSGFSRPCRNGHALVGPKSACQRQNRRPFHLADQRQGHRPLLSPFRKRDLFE
jgi:hypothetical protein